MLLKSYPRASKIINLAIFMLFKFSLSLYSQQLSEIMFYAAESDCEYIEIYNSTDTLINLSGYKIKYYNSSPDQIYSPDSNYILPPDKYAVILEADYDFETGIYREVLENMQHIYLLDDNSFGSSGMSNSSDREIYLISPNDDTVDVYTYTADNSKGHSDERKNFDENVWENSKLYLGTPGTKNSVSPFDFDIGITLFRSNDNYVLFGGEAELTIIAKNLGELNADEFIIKVENESTNEVIYEEIFQNLSTKDSLVINIQTPSILLKNNYFQAHVIYQSDEVNTNNEADVYIKGIEINEEMGDIVINEIMYSPKTPEPEWIEIYNVSDKEINLKNYKIADKSDTMLVIERDNTFLPGEFLVFADDTSILNMDYSIENLVISKFPTLNNSGDKIILLDSLDRVIDSLTYFNEWGGGDGLSLERIDAGKLPEDQSNWGESIFPTPGKVNSLSQKEYDIWVDSLCTIPDIPLIDSSVQFIAKMKNIGKLPLHFQIELFQDTNIDSIPDLHIETSNEIYLESGEETEYKFEYQANVTFDPKIFIAKLNIEDDFIVNNSAIFMLHPAYPRNSIVINEIHYSPINSEPEWIELYNKSKYDIKLKGWSLSDVLITPVDKTIDDDIIFKPQSYLVITKDMSILEYHRKIDSQIYELKFANLNNDEDGIVLIDNHQRTIDSVKYSNSWGGNKGNSLERLNINHNTNNENNWRSSIDLELSTPGRINSVTPKIYDIAVKSISNSPVFPVKGDQVNIITKIINYGKNEAENFNLLVSAKINGEEILNETSESYSLSSGDSIIIQTSKGFEITDTTSVTAQVNYVQDEDVNNNFAQKFIVPGFNSSTVLINEIMFKPNEGEPEWIEILNNTDSTVNLINWMIADSKSKYIICDKDLFIESKEYMVLCDNQENTNYGFFGSVLPDFGNSSDEVIIYDFRNSPIDSLSYKVKSDFSIGTSLERISLEEETSNPDNWIFSLAKSGSTPQAENSIATIPENNFSDLIVTEIMFDPSESNSEFIELVNNSDKDIEIGGWKFIDDKGSQFYLEMSSHILNKGEYYLLAGDSSIYSNYSWLNDSPNISIINDNCFSLTKTGTKLFLTDVKNLIIDSIYYSETWHNSTFLETKNISLELINSSLSRNNKNNWSSSVSSFGATPLKPNSINVKNLVSESKLEVTPNPFSPDNDGFEDFAFINYNLTETVSQVRIRIFDNKGRFIKTIANNQAVGSNGTIIFDGLDSNSNPLKIGIYIILFEAVNSNNVTVDVIKDVIVVARKL